MKVLKKLLGRDSKEPLVGERTDAELDAFLERLWRPFPVDWSHSKREEALPAYVRRQAQLASQLAAETNLPLLSANAGALESLWDHFLKVRRIVRSSHPRTRLKGSRETDLQLTHRYDLKTLELLEKIGAFLGIALQRAVPGLQWVVGHMEGKSYAYEGEPILRGFPGDFPEMNPTQVVRTLAHGAIASSTPGELGRVFRLWVEGTVVPGLEEEDGV